MSHRLTLSEVAQRQRLASEIKSRVPSRISARPAGPVQTGVTGFLAGAGLVALLGLTYMASEYQSSTEALKQQVDDLRSTIHDVQNIQLRFDALESSVRQLARSAAREDRLRLFAEQFAKAQSDYASEMLTVNEKLQKLGAK